MKQKLPLLIIFGVGNYFDGNVSINISSRISSVIQNDHTQSLSIFKKHLPI